MTSERRGKWQPTQSQISLAIDCATARVSITQAARLLNIGPQSLWLFARRVGSPSIFAIWKDRPRHEAISRATVAGKTPEMPSPRPPRPSQPPPRMPQIRFYRRRYIWASRPPRPVLGLLLARIRHDGAAHSFGQPGRIVRGS
jgi:hypothetical protein